MEWYWIVLIAVGAAIVALFILLFIAYMTNADLKLVEKTYNMLLKHHDKKNVKTKL